MAAPRCFLALLPLLLSMLPAAGAFKVIGVGWPKTGLASLERALSMLGLKVYRMGHSNHAQGIHTHAHWKASDWHLEDLKRWLEAIKSDSSEQLDTLADDLVSRGFDAILDVPLDLTSVALRLATHFPDAKLVLTQHAGTEEWFQQYLLHMKDVRLSASHFSVNHGPAATALKRIDTAVAELRSLPLVPTEADQDSYIAAYKKHIADVREKVENARLLEFGVADGWAPLCTFLGVGIPEYDYPVINTAAMDQAHYSWQRHYNMHFWGMAGVTLMFFFGSLAHWAYNKYRVSNKVFDDKANV
eukprot:TRINITY_DN81342_c0_g1_i1.p1 TRINITY_DN81342_c0_g1~~TRINITY_DN81342_c0_g1_i1.p1  ORF type:complete len:325 (-),score=68.12 TRINITY_DN81342_c0_g1_i1:63-965(-)